MCCDCCVGQRNKELEECIEAQKRQIKELEEKVQQEQQQQYTPSPEPQCDITHSATFFTVSWLLLLFSCSSSSSSSSSPWPSSSGPKRWVVTTCCQSTQITTQVYTHTSTHTGPLCLCCRLWQESCIFFKVSVKTASCWLSLEQLDWKILKVLVQNLKSMAEAGPLTCQPVRAHPRDQLRTTGKHKANKTGQRASCLTSIVLAVVHDIWSS